MTSDRPYRRGFPEAVAAGLLREGAGTQWDPELAAAFLDMREKGALAAALAPGGMVSRTRFLACPVDGEARSILDAVTIPPPARS
jgi:hypothetical protein